MRQFLPLLFVPLVFLTGLFFYVKIAGPIPFSVNNVTTTKQDVFSVSGEGKVSVKPDVAMVMIGIQANGKTVKQTQEQINQVSARLSSALRSLGVNEKDIKTVNYSINPNYDYRESGQKISGYIANSTLSVKVRDIDKLNDVIDSATANGANNVSGVNFDVDDKSKVEDEARTLAVAVAKKKAQRAASIAGFTLGRIINYSENYGGGYPVPMYAAMKADTSVVETRTQVEPGSSQVQVTVTLSYEIL